MDTRQLRYFTAIYEAASLSRAAEALNVAPSALSHHLANLEADLATALFTRRSRGMRPTAAGERLYAHARAILRAMAAAEADIRDENRAVAGEVSLGMAYSAVKAIGVPLLKRVMRDYPRLTLSLTESLSGSTLTHLMQSEIDLAVLYNPPNDPSLRLQPILEEQMVCIGRSDLIGDRAEPIRFEELLDLPLILLRQGLSARALLDDASLLKRLEARARLQINSVQAIAGALSEGLGCAIGTQLFMRDLLQSSALRARPIIEPELTRTLFLCERADRTPTFALETVRRLILQMIHEAVAAGDWRAKPVKDRSADG